MVRFLYGSPRYVPDDFFNYEDLLLLADYVKDRRQPHMLVGPRRTGKTSLLHVLAAKLRQQGVLTSYVDLEAARAEGFLTSISFGRHYSFAVIEDYLAQVGVLKRVGLSLKQLAAQTSSRVVAGLSRPRPD